MLDEEMSQNTEVSEEESSTTKPISDKDSILISIKKQLGGPIADCEDFDTDVIIHINTTLMILTQLGVGPSKGFSISDKTAVWTDFVSDIERIEAIKTYVYLKVKLIFDPPQSGAGMEALNKTITELEWRINVAAETKVEEV